MCGCAWTRNGRGGLCCRGIKCFVAEQAVCNRRLCRVAKWFGKLAQDDANDLGPDRRAAIRVRELELLDAMERMWPSSVA